MTTINIHSNETKIHLAPVLYHIDIVGGFGVNLNDFSISFIESKTGKILFPKEARWSVQSLDDARKVRILDLNVDEKGEYIIQFSNSKNVIVKKSRLMSFPFSLLPNKTVLNSDLRITVYRKF